MFSMVGMALCYAVLGACFYVKRQQAGASSQETGFSTAEFEHGWLPPLAIGTSQTWDTYIHLKIVHALLLKVAIGIPCSCV